MFTIICMWKKHYSCFGRYFFKSNNFLSSLEYIISGWRLGSDGLISY